MQRTISMCCRAMLGEHELFDNSRPNLAKWAACAGSQGNGTGSPDLPDMDRVSNEPNALRNVRESQNIHYYKNWSHMRPYSLGFDIKAPSEMDPYEAF